MSMVARKGECVDALDVGVLGVGVLGALDVGALGAESCRMKYGRVSSGAG